MGKRKMTKDQEQEAVRIALDGGDPLTFLEECGINNPAQKWYDIKAAVKDADPETYAKLPMRIQRNKTEKEPEVSLADAMAGMQKAADLFFGACADMGVETPENPVKGPVTPDELYEEFGKNGCKVIQNVTIPKTTRPVNYDGMTVRAVEGEFGSYHFQEISGKQWIDYDDKECANQLSMTVDQWRGFLKEMNHAAAILGVEL